MAARAEAVGSGAKRRPGRVALGLLHDCLLAHGSIPAAPAAEAMLSPPRPHSG
jgi:hypothetical protein